jgi:hypothetical protein
MVRRRGLGATVSAAVVFSIILISNFTVMFAAQDSRRLAALSDEETSLVDDALVLEGTGGLSILGRVQAFLASETLGCNTALQTVGSFIGGLSDVQRNGSLTVHETAALAPGVSLADNMSILQPYNGSVEGNLDFSIKIVATTVRPSDGVSYDRNETHLVNLPAHLPSAASLCEGSEQSIEDFLRASSSSNCTPGRLSGLIRTASASPAGEASNAGLGFNVTYSLSSTTPCIADFTIHVYQSGVPGPEGSFSFGLAEAGSATMENASSPPPP